MSIEGKVALITGAGQGIGRAIALRLASDGADISLVDVNPDRINAVADEVRAAGSKAISLVADVTDRDQVRSAVDRTERELGGFDIIVNNAGIAQVDPIADATPEDRVADPGRQRRRCAVGHPGRGGQVPGAGARRQDHQRVVDRRPRGIRDARRVLGDEVRGPRTHPAAAKEYASDGITVNAYCPGVVDTDMWITIDERFSALTGAPKGATFEKFVGGIALGRAQTPEDVAAYVSYLAGPDSDYMTGQAGLIDGGLVYR